MCSEEWNKVSGKNITPILSPELERSSGNYKQLLLICSYRGTRIAFTGDATERHLGTQRPKKKENLREITDMALPVTIAAKSISIKHHHVAIGSRHEGTELQGILEGCSKSYF